MKKYVLLLLGTVSAIALLLGVRAWTTETPVRVKLTTVEYQTFRQTVECTGKVELSGSEEVFVELPCIAGDVYVTAGQTVKKGDPLFSIDVDATQAVLSQWGTALPDTAFDPDESVTAPVSGVVTEISVKKGQTMDSSAPCAVIAPGENLQIAATIREKYLQQVAVGQKAEITGVGFAREVYHGTVTYIASTAHQQYGGTSGETVVAAVVSLDPDQADSSLRVGLNAKASIVVNTMENALLIPYNCIAQDEGGTEYVYLYGDDGIARRHTITVHQDSADGALVVSGISAGDRLVQDPDLLEGDRVLCEEG